jgi:hypothetical protein
MSKSEIDSLITKETHCQDAKTNSTEAGSTQTSESRENRSALNPSCFVKMGLFFKTDFCNEQLEEKSAYV